MHHKGRLERSPSQTKTKRTGTRFDPTLPFGTVARSGCTSLQTRRTPRSPLSVASQLVGVNNAQPAYALDVAGDLNLTGSLRVNGTAQQFGPTQEFHLVEDDAANDSEGAAIQLGNVNEIYISTAYQDDTWYFIVPDNPPDKITIAVNKPSNSCEVKLYFNTKFYPDGPADSWQGFHGNAGRVHIFIWDADDEYWLGY